jgi:fucose permease
LQFRYRGSHRESAVAQLFTLGGLARMALSKAQRYERLSKRAGIASSVCLIVWLVSMFGAATLKSSDTHPRDWIGIACGLSFLATVTCGVTCLAAAILIRFKYKESEKDDPVA